MCRFSGIVSHDGTKVIKMTEHQRRGGPDSVGFWNDDNVWLGHNRLSIIDLSSNGAQPMFSDRWVIVYNGELYDHHDVRQKLGPMHWRSHCDTLTLLNAIEHKGIQWTLNNIEGMFSFAAYDKYEKKIYLAVDPYGIKPMFWVKLGETFAFASSPAALTYLKPSWEMDEFALIDMLTLGGTKDPLFSGMKRLKGGQLLTYDIDTGIIHLTHWYSRKEHQCNEDDLIDAVKSSIQSVKLADVPVFMFLSGGIDSTIVATQCQWMNAVHLDSPEEQYARQVAVKYHNPFLLVKPNDYIAEDVLKDYAQQSGDCSMSAIQPYIVSKEVSKLGNVAISANGSDELHYGYNRMREDAATLGQYRHIFRNMKSGWPEYTDYKSASELELKTYVEYDLNKTLDFASMCHGLEVRVPYLNKQVVEMAMSIPRSVHVNGYGNKSILKKFLVSEGFSDQFVNRPKLGFSLHTQPIGYDSLKVKGLNLLKDRFNIETKFLGRDLAYFAASAAAFYSWFEVWEQKLK